MTPQAVILVEGVSDRIALETLAARRGRDLAAEGVKVVAIGGAQAVERAIRELGDVRVAGLYDVAEERAVLRGLERSGVAADGFFACDPDLEGELVRALGPERMLELVEERGQLGGVHHLQKAAGAAREAARGAAPRVAPQLEDPLRGAARRGARPRARPAAARRRAQLDVAVP